MDEHQLDLQQFGYKQELSRSLNLWHLTAFGINYMIPLAPAIIFGLIAATSGTTVALPYILAFFAMILTANSYAFMVRKYPISGSLYTYVSKAVSPHVGFVSGWILLLDYVLIPTVTSVSAVLYFQNYFPEIPFSVLMICYIALTGIVNIIGIKILANAGLLLLVIGELVLVLSFIIWGSHVVAEHNSFIGLFSLAPFQFTDVSSLLTATSIAVLSYLGFDAITTLSEEANRPKKDIPRAIFLSICIGGLTMFICGYLGILASPNILMDIHNSNWQNTALFFISKQTGGNVFAEVFTAAFILSMFVFNVVATATAAGSRLLFGMGRDGVLPKSIFGKINKRFKTPHYNIMIIVLIECVLGMSLSIDLISEMVNFGALLGFSLLNFSVIYFTIKNAKQTQISLSIFIKQLIFPFVGMLVLFLILISMNRLSLSVGLIWLLLGILYGVIWSRGYKKVPPTFNL